MNRKCSVRCILNLCVFLVLVGVSKNADDASQMAVIVLFIFTILPLIRWVSSFFVFTILSRLLFAFMRCLVVVGFAWRILITITLIYNVCIMNVNGSVTRWTLWMLYSLFFLHSICCQQFHSFAKQTNEKLEVLVYNLFFFILLLY